MGPVIQKGKGRRTVSEDVHEVLVIVQGFLLAEDIDIAELLGCNKLGEGGLDDVCPIEAVLRGGRHVSDRMIRSKGRRVPCSSSG